MNAKGRTLLKVVGIINIIIGILGVIGNLILLLGSSLISSMGITDFGAEAWTIGYMFTVYAVISIILSILLIVSGAVAVKHCNEISSTCFIWGIVLVIVEAISIILSAIGGGFTVSSILGFLFPVLYLIGGAMNRKAPVQQ